MIIIRPWRLSDLQRSGQLSKRSFGTMANVASSADADVRRMRPFFRA